jgi:hypothetical protein
MEAQIAVARDQLERIYTKLKDTHKDTIYRDASLWLEKKPILAWLFSPSVIMSLMSIFLVFYGTAFDYAFVTMWFSCYALICPFPWLVDVSVLDVKMPEQARDTRRHWWINSRVFMLYRFILGHLLFQWLNLPWGTQVIIYAGIPLYTSIEKIIAVNRIRWIARYTCEYMWHYYVKRRFSSH